MLTSSTLTTMPPVVDTVNMEIEEIAEARRPYHHGNLRETLIDAGTELARTGGPTAVVLRAVSREANVSHNAAYRHFADHEDLLAAVSARCMRQLGLLMTERMAAHNGRQQGQPRLGQARGNRPGLYRVRNHRARLVPYRIRRRRPARQAIDDYPQRRSGPAQPVYDAHCAPRRTRRRRSASAGASPGRRICRLVGRPRTVVPHRRRSPTRHSGRRDRTWRCHRNRGGSARPLRRFTPRLRS